MTYIEMNKLWTEFKGLGDKFEASKNRATLERYHVLQDLFFNFKI